MSNLEKSEERLRARPSEADFSDVRRVLEGHGWAQARQQGSHVSFTKAGHRSITVPLFGGRKVKRAYLDQICGILGLTEK